MKRALLAALLVLPGCSMVLGDYPFSDSPKSKFGKPAAVEYRVWAAQTWVTVSDEKTKSCDVTLFALTTRRHPSRLLVDGVEQALDTSWSIEERVAEGVHRTWSIEFLDPVGGAQLACRTAELYCVSQYASQTKKSLRPVHSCVSQSTVANKKSEKPSLIASSSPQMAMFDAAIGGAVVTVRFSIAGQLNEAWHCPRLDVSWPDDTKTVRESDCDPWPAKADSSWSFSRVFPGGEYKVRGCLSKAGRILTCQDATVRVVGGEQ